MLITFTRSGVVLRINLVVESSDIKEINDGVNTINIEFAVSVGGVNDNGSVRVGNIRVLAVEERIPCNDRPICDS